MNLHAALGLALVLLVGCGPVASPGRPTHPPRHAVTLSEVETARCVRGAPGRDQPYREELPGAVSDPELLAHLARFSPDVRRAAQAAGVEHRLASLMRVRDAADGEPSVELLSMRQALEAQLGSLGTQLLTVEFEAECIIALIKQTLTELDEDKRSTQLALTISSLVVGATAAIAAGVWDLKSTDSKGPIAVGIAGGSASALLAAAAFLPKRQAVVFMHEHNLLAPIARGEDIDDLYPTFVFRLLALAHVTGAPTPRDTLLAEWQRLIEETVPTNERDQAEALLFGEGGVYDAELLALRQRLFETLESTADSLARDIDLLNAAVHGVLDEAEPP